VRGAGDAAEREYRLRYFMGYCKSPGRGIFRVCGTGKKYEKFTTKNTKLTKITDEQIPLEV
jgi:hypothetical protein